MKLVDIIVKDENQTFSWGGETKYMAMDPDGRVFGYEQKPEPGVVGWSIPGIKNSTDGLGCRAELNIDDVEHWSIAIITRAQYESALAAKNDGWIEWGGGNVPVEEGKLVDCRYRDGAEFLGLRADEIGSTSRDASCAFWRHDGGRNDIIAYHLHKPAEVKPEWNGEGLPPVGCEFEYSHSTNNDGTTHFARATMVASGKQISIILLPNGNEMWVDNTIGFRPLRTEADRKRDAAIAKLTNAICGEIPDTGMATSEKYAERVYSSIAAGKIPGVKLED